MDKTFNILFSPLEWGLGHAGRLIPLIRKLRERGHNIFIASGPVHTDFFRSESCEAFYINFPGFRPVYSGFIPQYLMIMLQLPLLVFHTIRDNWRLRKVIERYGIELVISDNRFGMWNKRVKSVYITHQLLIPFPRYLRFLEPAGAALHRIIIRKYNFCFIPDLPGDNALTGKLAHGTRLPGNEIYTGILSRFADAGNRELHDNKLFAHNTVILSGPEPQKGILRKKVTEILKNSGITTVVLEGKPDEDLKTEISGNIIFHSHLTSPEMSFIIRGSKSIICRPGYTTIMELISLGCTALLVPTPGQTEQEYLAGWLSSRGWFTTITQRSIRDSLPLCENGRVTDQDINGMSRELLGKALEEILK